MAIQTATNQETGERVALVNGEWQPILQSATNAAGAKAFLVGNEWLTGDTPTPVASAAPEQKTTANPFVGALGRAASLAGAGVGAVAESAERLGDKLELAMPISGISPEDIKNKKQLQPLFDWAKSLKDFDESLGYQPSTQLKELGSNPLKAIPFIAERVVTSSPDMVAAVGVLPAYIVARTKEILDERVKNDGKTLDEATVGDVTAAAGAAIVEGTLERFATKGLLKPTTGATKTGRVAKEAGVQAGTEVAQEELSYLAEAAGTKKGLSAEEALTRGAEAALVGGGLGAAVQGTKEALAPKAVVPDAVAPDERIEPTLEAQDAPISPTAPAEEAPAGPSGVVGEPTGASVPVAGEPGAVTTAEGVAGVEPSGVVPSAEDAGGVAAGEGNVPTAVGPVVTRNSPPADPNTLWSPTVTLDYGNYTIENDGASAVYSFKAPAKIAPTASVLGMTVSPNRTTLLATNKAGQEILVRAYPDHIRLENIATMAMQDHDFGSGAKTTALNKVLGKGLVDKLEALPAEERVGALTDAIAQKLQVADLGRFSEEYAAMQSGTPLTQPTTEEPPSGTETPEAQQAEAQGQAAPAVPPAAEEVTATAEQLAPAVPPQEVSANEDEVRSSAVPLPGGRVEPYLSRSTEPLTVEEATAESEESGISVFEKLRKSRLGEEGPAIADALQARDPRTAITVLRSLVDRNWSNMSYKAIQALVAQPTFTFLADWSGIKALDDAAIQLQEMHGFSQTLLADTYEMSKELRKELNPLFSNPEAYREKFTDLAYGSTLARYDPSDPASTPLDGRNATQKADARKLDQLYKAVGAKGQQMYKNLVSHYSKMIKLYSDLLDAQIMQLPGMSSEAKENLINVLRKTFEADARIRPFIPLVRRGDFWMRVDEMKGADLHTQFYMFESVGDRDVARTTMLNENPNAKISSGEGISQLRIKTYKTSEMLTKIFDEIDKENFGAEQDSGAAKESLKDAIYQVYLNTMPEQSFRNQFIHRKDVTGFSTDLLRNISTTASRTSMQLARLKYSPLLRNSLSAARDAVEGRPNMSPFVIEAEKRVNLALAGEGGGLGEAIAGAANKASYFWFLSGVSSALIQPASVYIAGFPVLAGNHNNVSGAAYELARVSKLIGQFGVVKENKDGTTSYTAPSIANNKSLTALEREAVSQMTDRGVTNSTYASLVYGHRDTNILSSTTILGKAGYIGAEGAKMMTSSLMHNIERMTREAVFLAAYRLGVKELGHEGAINQAVKDVNEALGNYDISNRPRWTQRGLGKMAFQFKMFPLHTTLMLLTNFAKMLPLLNKEGKKAAAIKFFGTYMTVGSIAGMSGLPFFSTSLAAVAYAFKALQDDDDWPKELKDMDAKTWFKDVFLPDLIGEVSIFGTPLSEIVDTGPINAITGSAISERIGLNDMFGRDMKEMKTAREGMSQLALELAGPSVGLALSFADAYDAYQVGDIQKMQERLSPAALRNILATFRIADEGILDSAGNAIVEPEDVDVWRLANQAVGFRSATQAKASDVPAKLKGVTQKIANKRMLIQNRIKFQARKGTVESLDKMGDIIDNEVLKFNDEFPRQKILFGDIREMINEDRKNRLNSRVGMNPDLVKKNIELVDDALYHLENRISREEKARQAAKEK